MKQMPFKIGILRLAVVLDAKRQLFLHLLLVLCNRPTPALCRSGYAWPEATI